MSQKLVKFLIKMIFVFPIGFLFWNIPNGFESDKMLIPIIGGIGISFLIIFWNVFEYEKHNNISSKDFLESKHSIDIENNEENWNKLREILNHQFIKRVKFKETDGFILVQIDQKIANSILIAEKIDQKINLRIKRKNFNFLPDMAENYRLLTNLIKIIK